MAFYYSVDSAPAARQVVLILDPPRAPRGMFLLELDYSLFKFSGIELVPRRVLVSLA